MSELIENIDIGGPTLIRAAAKNYQDVAVVASPDDYPAILAGAARTPRRAVANPLCGDWRKKAFALTAAYDRAISTRLARVGAEDESGLPAFLDIRAPRALDLRYGENPHQKAALYSNRQGGIAGAEQLQGKELSYNNLVDLDAAWQLIQRIRAAGRGHHQAHQSVRVRGRRPRWPRATGGRSKPIRCRRTAACWRSIATVDRRNRARRSRRPLSKRSPRPIMTPRRANVLAAKKNLRLLTVISRRPRSRW